MKQWTITWGERTWTDEDLLGCDLATAQALVGGGWSTCDPWHGPMELMSMIAALESRATQQPVAEILNGLRFTPATVLLSAIEER